MKTKPAEWSGSPCPLDPDGWWQDDATGERVSAATGERRPYTREELKRLENPPSAWEDCGCCGGTHPPAFTGDCRDDNNRWPS